MFDDNKIKMARKRGKKQKINLVGCTGEGKRWKGNIREGSREGKTVNSKTLLKKHKYKTGIVLKLSLEVIKVIHVSLALTRVR